MTKENFNSKVNLIQTKIKASKSNYNSFGKYSYRSCEDITESVKPHLEETGLTLLMNDEVQVVPVEGQNTRVYIKATVTLTDGENEYSVSAIAREPEEKKGCDPSQVTGGASSYARKYALNGLLCIDDTKDADTEKPYDPKPKQKQKKDLPKPKNTELSKTIEKIGSVISNLTTKGSTPNDIITAIKAGGHDGKFATIKELTVAKNVLIELNKIK